ncbi:unnamed protein product [Arabis nemorensis]|uniref:O-methyltransferase C-terminal domain-containing protein n=1 Tax=Arabis nemorensis TaxID=586526 RepID=A0A565AME3_9BRAS|nr:unnamed protein product [Arabis nemorensis]
MQVSFCTKRSHLTASILEGGLKPFERARGSSLFEHMAKNESALTEFNEMMVNHTSLLMKKLVKTYNGFESLSDGVLVDVGGVEHVGGDMFDAVPQGHAILLKWILHDWSDEQCVEILKNCKKALPKDGKVIIVESIMPREISETDLATKVILHMDVVMMAKTIGGKERTKEEFDYLAMEAGFKLPKISYGAYANWILELYKEE